jgi:hypothetical protein
MRRALDKASSPAEGAKAAEAFVSSLRKRGIDGYEFIGAKTGAPPPQAPSAPKSPPPPPPKAAPPEPEPRDSDSNGAEWNSSNMRPAESATAQPPKRSDGYDIVARVLGMLTVWFVIHACQHHGAYNTSAAKATPSPMPQALEAPEAFYVGEHVYAKVWASGDAYANGQGFPGTIRGTLADDATVHALSGMQVGDIFWIQSTQQFVIFEGYGRAKTSSGRFDGPEIVPWWEYIGYGITKQAVAQPSPKAGDAYWVKSNQTWDGICTYTKEEPFLGFKPSRAGG